MKKKYTTNLRFTAFRFAVLVIFMSVSTGSWGQIAAWQFGTPASVGNEITYNPTTVNSNVTVTPLLRGSGIPSYGLVRGFSSINWNATSLSGAITDKEYYELKIQANTGRFVSLSKIDAILRRSPYGPRKYIWRYSTDGENFTDIGTYKSFTSEAEEGVAQTQIDLSDIRALQNVQNSKTITLRLYAWDAIATTGTFAIGLTPAATSTNALAISGTAGTVINPAISTQAVTNIINTIAIANGTVTISGSPAPTEIGICWATTENPTIENFKATSESSTSEGTFKAYLKNLTPNTTYYARAYLTSGSVTTYGQEQITFTSGSALTAIPHYDTKNFAYKHNVLAAGYYRGRAYSIYTVDTNDNLNIGDLSVANNSDYTGLNISQENHSDVSAGNSYTSGSIAVRNDTLFAIYRDNSSNYILCEPFLADATGKLVKTNSVIFWIYENVTVNLPNHPNTNNFGTFISSTVFNNEIYMLVQRDDANDKRLYLIKGKPQRLNPLLTSINWEFVDVVKDEKGTEISVNPTFTNNTDSYDITTMKGTNGTDSLVVGRSSKNKITLHLFRGVNNWATYEKPVNDDVSKCFRMVQGAFEGSGAIENKNTLQCIGKNDNITLTEAFDIDERKFVGEHQLTLHDGNFAACINLLDANSGKTYYKQYISIITGDLTSNTDVDTYKSNTLFCVSKTNTDPKLIVNTPSLRPLATLFGVIEGTPPTIFETEQDYINNDWVSSAKLVKAKGTTKENKTSQSFTGGAEAKIGNDFCSVAVEYKRSNERSQKKTVTVTNTMTCADREIAHRDSATLLYTVPGIMFNSFYLCTPQSNLTKFTKVIEEPIVNDISITDAQNIVKINRSLQLAPFNITNPRDFTKWSERPMFSNFVSNSTNSLYASSDFDFSSIQSKQAINVATEIVTENSNEVTVTVEAKFFSFLDIKASSSYKITKSHSNAINESLELELTPLSRYKFPQYNNVSFKCNAMLLTKGNTQVDNYYYPALRAEKLKGGAKMCEDNENPWVIAYNITGLYVNRVITANTYGAVNNTSDLLVKLYRQSANSINFEINSIDNERITVELYALNGQKVQTLFNDQQISAGSTMLSTDCSIPTGVYVVKTQTSQGLNSSLVKL